MRLPEGSGCGWAVPSWGCPRAVGRPGGLGVQPAGRAAAGSAFWKVWGRVRGRAQGPGAQSKRSLRLTSLRVALCPRGFTCLRAQVVCPLGGLLRPRRPRGLLGVWLSGPRDPDASLPAAIF